MNAFLEISDMLGLDYYYASVSYSGNAMLLSNPDIFYGKFIEKRIILSEIEKIQIFFENGIEKLDFRYDDERYTFVNYGNGIIPYLKDGLSFVLNGRNAYAYSNYN